MPYKDLDEQRAAVKRTRVRNQQFVRDAKNVPCVDCKARYHFSQMDFDHVRGAKKFELNAAQRGTHSLTVIAAEIDKCDAVCANCHRLRTYKQQHSGMV